MTPEDLENHFAFWTEESARLREELPKVPEADRQGVKDRLAECLYNLAICQGEKGDWRQSQQSLREVLDLVPEWPQAWNNLGCVLWSLSEPLRARAAWEEALRLDPDGEGGQVARENLDKCPMPPTQGVPD